MFQAGKLHKRGFFFVQRNLMGMCGDPTELNFSEGVFRGGSEEYEDGEGGKEGKGEMG